MSSLSFGKSTSVSTASGIPISTTFEKMADALERIAVCLENQNRS